ncbi:MAG: PHP domain-containing protein [Propionibacteriaceae bacterium]|jgi:predicted metal-dependent phosphoesterase TrpH|nr:PHP domain-containing protein [Propionibacteriaceae bacterium]
MRIDLHVHSALSDGTDTIPELIKKAVEAHLDVIALTDHDHMAGVEEAQHLGTQAGLKVLRGVEMSTHIDVPEPLVPTFRLRRPVHLLGYGCRPTPELTSLLADVRAAREDRIPATLEKLAALGMPLTLEEVEEQAARATSIGRPHVADALVARGYVPSRDVAFARYLYDGGPAYVSRYTPTTGEAIDAVNAAHGVPVLAHVWARGNATLVTADIITEWVRDHNLAGIEVDHVDHDEETRHALAELAKRLGLIRTGSSDYHGSGKTRNPLGACLTDPEQYERLVRIIHERGGQE